MNPVKFIVEYLQKYRVLRFLIVGFLNTVFGFGMFVLIGLFIAPIWLHSLLATVIGTLFSFKTMGKLVFKNSSNQLVYRFIGVYSFIYLVNVFFLIVANNFKMNINLSQALLILPMATLSYILNKNFVFKK